MPIARTIACAETLEIIEEMHGGFERITCTKILESKTLDNGDVEMKIEGHLVPENVDRVRIQIFREYEENTHIIRCKISEYPNVSVS